MLELHPAKARDLRDGEPTVALCAGLTKTIAYFEDLLGRARKPQAYPAALAQEPARYAAME